MRKAIFTFVLLLLVFGIPLSGCSKKAANAKEAISVSKTMDKAKRYKYLLSQANNFYFKEDYPECMKVSQYILKNINSKSAEAKKLFKAAKVDHHNRVIDSKK